MPKFINDILNEPIYVKVIIGIVGVVIILGLTRLLQRSLTRSIDNIDLRYQRSAI